MRRAGHATLLAGAALALAAALAACDRGELLAWLGQRAIREVSAETALAWSAQQKAFLVQPHEPEQARRALAGAHLVGPEEPLPSELAARAAGGAWVLVVARRPEDALRLAARLSRDGYARVGVVAGDAAAELRMAARRGDRSQPPGTAGHRRD